MASPPLGLTQVRLQTWFPFNVHVVLNGREWLARELDGAKIGYLRRDSCLAAIEDFTRAQKLADKLGRPVHDGQRRHRGLRPFDPQRGETARGHQPGRRSDRRVPKSGRAPDDRRNNRR